MTEPPDRIYRQSAAIPLWGGGVVLITSRKRRRWIVPKGIVEPGMTPAESAAREALEEAGILGAVRPESIGHFRYRKWEGVCAVDVFVLDVTRLLDTWDEMHVRTREVVPLETAVSRVEEAELRRMMAALRPA